MKITSCTQRLLVSRLIKNVSIGQLEWFLKQKNLKLYFQKHNYTSVLIVFLPIDQFILDIFNNNKRHLELSSTIKKTIRIHGYDTFVLWF